MSFVGIDQEIIDWISVDERLPEDCDEVLVKTARGVQTGTYTRWAEQSGYETGWYDVREDCADCRGWKSKVPLNWPLKEVTHWAAMPKGKP
jgi:hypothetical protein